MSKEIKLHGIAASPGIGIGKIFIYRKAAPVIARRRVSDTESEAARFGDALSRARAELTELRALVVERLGPEESALWDAQLMMLSDGTTYQTTLDRIREQQQDAASAFKEVMDQVADRLERSDNQYLKERVGDIRDIAWRVIAHIQDQGPAAAAAAPKEAVVLAHELSPADVAYFSAKKVVGLVTEIGGKTSHTAIIARSLEVPAAVGVKGSMVQASQDDLAIVDGSRGLAIVNPSPATLEFYRREQRTYTKHVADLKRLRKAKAITKDGHQVELSANIELPEEAASVLSHGAKGVGLFRTEFIYLTSDHMPTEEEQFAIYRRVAEKLAPDPVIIRTFDLGGDKVDGQHIGPESNPFLGWRAIRFCLARPEVFKAQIRAILKASAFGQVKIMFPMISGLEELRRAKAMVEEVKLELAASKTAFDRGCQLGIMIETPSAALTSSALAPEVDFFSIGSNDLTQYTLAVDRANEKVANLYDPFHPAVLRLVREVIENGHRAGIWVGMCGEMCADPLAVPLLLGLSLDEFSMNPIAVPEVKRMILSLRLDECRRVAAKAMEAESAERTRAVLSDFVLSLFPDLALACSVEGT
jgi:phosphotransferase system enzyme I (PtsI)